MLAMREVRAIYHQGVYAVAAAFRQLYEVIEVEDERVQKRVTAATAAHLRRIEQLQGRINHLVDILLRYEGVCVHDGFGSYDRYRQCRHAQCNAHLLRELNYVIETSKARWAAGMKELLLEIKAAVEDAREGGRKRLSPRLKAEFRRRYDEAVGRAKKLYGTLQRRGVAKRRKRAESPIKAAGRKLACRLEAKREEVLLFMEDFAVPFDNNQSERDLRMLKVKQKVSGCFRTERGAEDFCRMRGYLSTMRKQGHGVMETIKSLCAGRVLMPALRC